MHKMQVSIWKKKFGLGVCCVVFLGGSVCSALSAEAYFSPSDGFQSLSADERQEALDRTRKDGLGIQAGSFVLLPMIEVGAFYDNNIFARSSNVVGDGQIYLNPSVDIRSTFSRHALDASVDVERFQNLEYGSQSRTNVRARLTGRVDLQRDFVVNVGLKGAYLEDTPGDFNSPIAAASPVHSRDLVAWGSATKAFNRLTASLGGSFQTFDYDDVLSQSNTIIDQDYRDGHVWTTGGRLSYEVSPGYRVFGDVRYNKRDYQKAIPFSSDSDGYKALGGVDLEISRLLRAEFSAGYMAQNYDQAGVGTQSGFTYGVDLAWQPTPLVAAYVSANRVIEGTFEPGTVGSTRDLVSVRVDYEVLRDVVLSPSFVVAFDDYYRSPLQDTTYEAGFKVNYSLNRFYDLGVQYRYINRDFTGTLSDYDKHVVGIYAQARY